MYLQIDDTAGYAGARVTRRAAIVLASLATIVNATVHDKSEAYHTVWSGQRDESGAQRAFGIARAVNRDIAQISCVAYRVGQQAVAHCEGVDC
jgi:hypothetical protein